MGIKSNIVYAGRNLSEFGVIISKTGAFHAADRDYSVCDVPGRNGNLTIDNGRYKNVEIQYSCTIGRGFKRKMDHFFQFLMAQTGYHRLEDSDQPDYYRMARVASAPSPDIWPCLIGGTFDIAFDCKPQRFLKDGEMTREFTSNGTIYNTTSYDALPMLRVYGTGALGVGSCTITITSANVYTDIDCETQDAYKGTTNCNPNIRLDSGTFPSLPPGSTGITLGGSISKVEVIPRWWTI